MCFLCFLSLPVSLVRFQAILPYFPYPFVTALPVSGSGGYVEFRTQVTNLLCLFVVFLRAHFIFVFLFLFQCLCSAPQVDMAVARKCRAKVSSSRHVIIDPTRRSSSQACRECVASSECVWCDIGPLSSCSGASSSSSYRHHHRCLCCRGFDVHRHLFDVDATARLHALSRLYRFVFLFRNFAFDI